MAYLRASIGFKQGGLSYMSKMSLTELPPHSVSREMSRADGEKEARLGIRSVSRSRDRQRSVEH